MTGMGVPDWVESQWCLKD